MSPDPQFALDYGDYAKARSHLEYGLTRGEGIVVITGIPGTGKSMVVDDLLSRHAGSNLVIARLLSTQLKVDELLRMVAYSLHIQLNATDKASVLIAIQRYLHEQYAKGNGVLLIVDEAQNLSAQGLEELRLLTNVQDTFKFRFQLFLVGQPPLRDLIRSPKMEQLRQRVIAYCNLEPLSLQTTHDYIEHRLTVAGWTGDPTIAAAAITQIHRYSRGIPRRINLICSRLLLGGFAEAKHELDENDVHVVMGELTPEMVESSILDDADMPQLSLQSAGSVPRRDVSAIARSAARATPIFGSSPVVAGERAAALGSVPDVDRPISATAQAVARPTAVQNEHEAALSREADSVPLAEQRFVTSSADRTSPARQDGPRSAAVVMLILLLLALGAIVYWQRTAIPIPAPIMAWFGQVLPAGLSDRPRQSALSSADAALSVDDPVAGVSIEPVETQEDIVSEPEITPDQSTTDSDSAIAAAEPEAPGVASEPDVSRTAAAEVLSRPVTPERDSGVQVAGDGLEITYALERDLRPYAGRVERLGSGALRIVPIGFSSTGTSPDFTALASSIDGIAFVLRNVSGIRVVVSTGYSDGADSSIQSIRGETLPDSVVARLINGGIHPRQITRQSNTYDLQAPVELQVLPALQER